MQPTRIRLNFGHVDRYNVLQFETEAAFSLRRTFTKSNMVIAEAQGMGMGQRLRDVPIGFGRR